MTTFKDLKSQWENQPEHHIPKDGSELIVQKMNTIKRKQGITNNVLFVTILILVGFFLYIEAYKNTTVTLALLLMMGSLLVRIFVEYLSIQKLKAIDVTKNSSVFNEDMIVYYKRRIRTHYITTPIIMILYSIGFIILMPFFKESLSSGFYTYICMSAIIVLVVMVFFIGKQIKKELSILRGIQD